MKYGGRMFATTWVRFNHFTLLRYSSTIDKLRVFILQTYSQTTFFSTVATTLGHFNLALLSLDNIGFVSGLRRNSTLQLFPPYPVCGPAVTAWLISDFNSSALQHTGIYSVVLQFRPARRPLAGLRFPWLWLVTQVTCYPGRYFQATVVVQGFTCKVKGESRESSDDFYTRFFHILLEKKNRIPIISFLWMYTKDYWDKNCLVLQTNV